MNLTDASIAPSFADPTNPNGHLTRLKKRVDAIGRQLHRLTPAMKSCEDQAVRAVADMAYANWLTAKGLTQAAEALANRRAVDLLLGGNMVEIEIAEVSMRDVRALSALSSRVKPKSPSTARAGADPEVTLGGKGRFGCIAPDPDSWLSSRSGSDDNKNEKGSTPPEQSGPGQTPEAGICLPSLTVVLPIDFATRNHSVQELLTLAEASLAEAERELGETRAHLCHTEDGSCQLF